MQDSSSFILINSFLIIKYIESVEICHFSFFNNANNNNNKKIVLFILVASWRAIGAWSWSEHLSVFNFMDAHFAEWFRITR